MSTTIKVKCTDQVMTFDSTPVIASGGLKEDYITFSFCTKWDGLTKTAVFWRAENDAYHVLLDENGGCAIPKEVLAAEGIIFFGVFGVNSEGVQRTSEVLSYRIVKGTITEGTKPSDPTADVYTQMLAKYNEALEKYAAALATVADYQEELDTKLANKSDVGHTHDDRYYTETEMDSKLANKSDVGHLHDDRYYTETEMDTKLAEKSDTTHTHDDQYYTETEMDTKLAEKASTARVETLAGLVSQIGDTKKTKRTSCGDNWALCNGAVVSSTDYPDLAAMLPVDLTDWHETGALTRVPLCAAEMSGKIVIGCTDGYVLVYDGLTEAPTEIKLGTSPHRDIVFDGTKLVSLSGNNVWQCSGDPATVGSWSSTAIGVSEITDVFAVAHSGSTWAIYAGHTSGSTKRGKVYTSSNLSTWTEQLDFGTSGYTPARIVCREGVFVGVLDYAYQPCCFVGDTTGAEWAKVTFEQHNNSGAGLAVTSDETYFYVRTFYYAFRATNPRGTWDMIHEGQLPIRGLLATPYGFLQADYSTATLSQTATQSGTTIKTFSTVTGSEGAARFVYLPASGVYLLLVPRTGEKIYYSGNLLPLIATDEDGLDTFIRVS